LPAPSPALNLPAVTLGDELLIVAALMIVLRPPWRFRVLFLLVIGISALFGVGG